MYLVILNGEVTASYRDEPTELPDDAELVEWDGPKPSERIVEIDGVLTPLLPVDPRDSQKKLLSAKWRKLKEINAWDEAVRLAGVAIGPYTLRYDEKGQNRIIILLGQVRELVEQGVITANTLVAFEDANGDTQKVKASVIRSAIQTYFAACQAQDEAVGDLKAQLKAAATIAEVEAIIVGA